MLLNSITIFSEKERRKKREGNTRLFNAINPIVKNKRIVLIFINIELNNRNLAIYNCLFYRDLTTIVLTENIITCLHLNISLLFYNRKEARDNH